MYNWLEYPLILPCGIHTKPSQYFFHICEQHIQSAQKATEAWANQEKGHSWQLLFKSFLDRKTIWEHAPFLKLSLKRFISTQTFLGKQPLASKMTRAKETEFNK